MCVFRARIFALCAAIALMLPAGATARPHYFCRMMERVRSSCCCAAERSEHEAERRAQVRGQDCCERVIAPTRAGASAASDATIDVPVAAVVAMLSAYEWLQRPLSVARAAERQARGPPGVGPPLFIAHCALLT